MDFSDFAGGADFDVSDEDETYDAKLVEIHPELTISKETRPVSLRKGRSFLVQKPSIDIDGLGPRYAGKIADLDDPSEGEEEQDESSGDEELDGGRMDDGEDDKIDNEKLMSTARGEFVKRNQFLDTNDSSSSSSEEEEVDDEREVNDDENDVDMEAEVEDVEMFDGRLGSHLNVTPEVARGKAVQSQMALCDRLLELRIRLQKLLNLTNQLPVPGDWPLLTETEPAEDTTTTVAEDNDYKPRLTALTQQNQADSLALLNRLVLMQGEIMDRNEEVIEKNVIDKGDMNEEVGNDDDEEIESDEDVIENVDVVDDEVDADDGDVVDTDGDTKNKLLKLRRKRGKKTLGLEVIQQLLKNRNHLYRTIRDGVLDKCDERVRLTSIFHNKKLGGKKKSFANTSSSSSLHQSITQQIQQILSNKTRLLMRTQVKRDGSPTVTTAAAANSNIDGLSTTSSSDGVVHQPEIFDDSDFYEKQLRELIEGKVSRISDPILIGKQHALLESYKTKIKKSVDTRASKGRKIRYDVHNKLASFMTGGGATSKHESSWTHEARNELFGSLFGNTLRGPTPQQQQQQQQQQQS